MANGRGGYRKPTNPAPVSGPGSLSRRTDGGPAQVVSTAPNQPYGEAKQQAAQQAIQPMGAAAPLPPAANVSPPSGGGGQQPQPQQMPPYQGGDFAGPSQRPDEHVMTMPSSLPQPQQAQGTGYLTQLLTRLSAADTSGIMGQLLVAAQARNA